MPFRINITFMDDEFEEAMNMLFKCREIINGEDSDGYRHNEYTTRNNLTDFICQEMPGNCSPKVCINWSEEGGFDDE